MIRKVLNRARLSISSFTPDYISDASAPISRRDISSETGIPMICLSMIVKNEAPVIRRCLDSVRSLIDFGSSWTRVPPMALRRSSASISAMSPAELHERPWVDFAHNRSEALALARPHADYTLIIDADDALEVPEGFQLPPLRDDSYLLDIHDTAIHYQRTQIVANRLPWRVAGVLHEFLTCEGAVTVGHLPIIMRRNHDGARRRDRQTYHKDAQILERALLTETDPFLIARYRFYLAQSYRDFGQVEKAIESYMTRSGLGYWDQEIFFSLYQAAKLGNNSAIRRTK